MAAGLSRRRRAVLVLGSMVLLAATPAACAKKGDQSEVAPSPCHGKALTGSKLLACVGPAIAYVETASSTGSGVLLADGYVVTNAHVLDPYRAADLTFPDGSSRLDVPVVGIDALADIAVLGPVPHASRIDATPLQLGTGAGVEKGADVYLIGYPGEGDAKPDPAISRGLLSRTRTAKEFGQTYLQTDAAIGGGQSGGALVDGSGHLLGISGLSFAEEFALALDGTDVQQSVDKIVAGHGDAYAALPNDTRLAQDHAVDLVDELDGATFVIPAAPQDRNLQVVLGPTDGVALMVFDLYGETLLLNGAARDLSKATLDDDLSDIGVDVAEPTAPGTYEVTLPADIESVVLVDSLAPTPVRVSVRTSLPSEQVPVSPRTPITLGGPVETSFDYFEHADVYTVDLHAGDEVDVLAQSPQGDVAVLVHPPGGDLSSIELLDDGGGGIYDSDASGTYTAKVDGSYAFGVFSWDGVVTGYRFSVSRG